MKITDYIICDDIRQEANDKQSLIGVVGDTFRVLLPPNKEENKPVPIRLGIFLRVIFTKDDIKKNIREFELILRYADQDLSMGKGAIKSETEVKDKLALSVVFNNFPFLKTDDLEMKLVFFNDKGEEVDSISPSSTIRLEGIEDTAGIVAKPKK